MSHFHFSIQTPAGTMLACDVDELVAPGAAGELGILPGHVAALVAVKPGVTSYRGVDGRGAFATGTGYLEVGTGAGACVCLLVDRAEAAAGIDLEAAARETERLEKSLGDGADVAAELAWATARLHAARRSAQ